MKYYKMYMNRQEVSPELHARLLSLTEERKPAPARRAWVRWGAMAACCALVAGLGLWRISSPARSGPGAEGPNISPGTSQTAQPGPDLSAEGDGFVVTGPDGSAGTCWEYGPSAGEGSGSAGSCWVNFFSIPYINYQNVDGRPAADVALSWELMEGSFSEALTREDIQTIFWGAGGKPADASGDLPWTLSWEGYTVKGSALYDKGGDLLWVTLEGEGGGSAVHPLPAAGGAALSVRHLLRPGDHRRVRDGGHRLVPEPGPGRGRGGRELGVRQRVHGR